MLNDVEVRVLGALIEKEKTTPEYYPLSLNALVNACNQSSNRHPVVHFDEATVERALEILRQQQLAHVIQRGESRVTKYRHVMDETMHLETRDIAVMCVLMLRGPQTPGEVKSRSSRLYDFQTLEEVDSVLNALIARQPSLVARLPRQPGQKELRYAHLLSGEVAVTEPEAEVDRIGKLEKEVDDLRKQFDQFRKQFE